MQVTVKLTKAMMHSQTLTPPLTLTRPLTQVTVKLTKAMMHSIFMLPSYHPSQVTVKLTKAMMHSIFTEQPSVRRVFLENVCRTTLTTSTTDSSSY